MVALDALDLSFYHINLPEVPSDLHRLFQDAPSVPRDLTHRISLDKSTPPLGSGAFGEVWHAKLDGADVAVKTAKNGKWEVLFNETRRLLAFENAPHTIRRHIMPVLGMMRDGDFWALVMPRMDHDLRKQSRLNTGQVALGLAKALSAIHAQGLIHCDVKDANVFISKDEGGEPIPVIGDFGCCIGARDPKPRKTGTAFYRDPAMRSGNYGTEVDIYSFGKLLEALIQRNRSQSPLLEQLTNLARQCQVALSSAVPRPTADHLKAQLSSMLAFAGGSRSQTDVRALVVRDLAGPSDASHQQSMDTEMENILVGSAASRALPDTLLNTECRSVDRDFVVYVSSQGRFHHPTCSIVAKWHTESNTTKFTKQTFSAISKARRSKGCSLCQSSFQFRSISAAGRLLPCPVPQVNQAEVATGSGARTSRVRFSLIEDGYLREGMRRFGDAQNRWARILETYPFLPRRTSVDLKDRWRNMPNRDLGIEQDLELAPLQAQQPLLETSA